MSNFFVSPFLFWAGLIAIASPIIIHLLNKRRFKRVDWAAMDFLLQADKINKRRVKLEDLILLLMRCLIMGLIGLLLARPFFSFDSSGGLFKSTRHERVIILDDSLSMNAQMAGTTPMVEAGKTITNWMTTLASNNATDSLTLLLTSRPDRALYRDEPLTEDTVNQVLEDLKGLKVSDVPNQLVKTLEEVEEMFDPASGGSSVNRIVYVVSDFRQRDWAPEAQKEVMDVMRRIAENAASCYLVDAGSNAGDGGDNVVIESISPRDKALITGVPSEFEVTVRNLGSAAATDLKVRLAAGDGLPLERVIDRIAPGDTGAAAFTYTFARPENLDDLQPVRLQADIVPDDGDNLKDDNQRFFPARVTSGLKVLIIDGDPSSTYGEGASFFLQKALSPRGRAISGLELTVADDSELTNLTLSDYQVIYLVNVYRVDDAAREALEQWTEDGGGLVIALGDQIDEESYNDSLYRDGEGLLPIQLGGIAGDEEAETWALVDPQITAHPILRLFDGDASPLLEGVKVFQWWSCSIPQAAVDSGKVSSLAILTNEQKTPLLVEQAFGEGRVMTITTALDLDWNNWPTEAASYLIMLQEMTRYMAPKRTGEGVVPVGAPLTHDLELTEFRPDGQVITPSESSLPVRALPKTAGEQSTTWQVRFDDTGHRGFYQIELTPTDGGEVNKVLFAANVDTSEGDLARADRNELKSTFEGARVQLVAYSASLMEMGATKSRSEYWRWVLYALLAFLCLELLYGYWLGARR